MELKVCSKNINCLAENAAVKQNSDKTSNHLKFLQIY